MKINQRDTVVATSRSSGAQWRHLLSETDTLTLTAAALQSPLLQLVARLVHRIFMAALRSRYGHFIFALWFLLSSSSSSSVFSRPISAVAGWMFTILPKYGRHPTCDC